MTDVMLVTGGSRGIGAAICRLAADRGYDVAVNYAGNEEAAASVVRDVEATGRRAVAVRADVRRSRMSPACSRRPRRPWARSIPS